MNCKIYPLYELFQLELIDFLKKKQVNGECY